MKTPTNRPSCLRCLLVAFCLGLLALGMTSGDADARKIGTKRSPHEFIRLCYDAGGQTIIINLPDGNVIVGCYFPNGDYIVCDYSTGVCDDQERDGTKPGGDRVDVGSTDNGGVVVDPASDSDSITDGEVAPLDSNGGVLVDPQIEEPTSELAPLDSNAGIVADDDASGDILIFADTTYEIQYLAPIEPLP
jgi:hypothetical protein